MKGLIGLREIYSVKKAHIEEQIDMLQKVRKENNADKVDKEIDFQRWRLKLLDKYETMSDKELLGVQTEFKKTMDAGLWEIRKSPPLSFLSEDDKKKVVELSIVEILLGEY